MAMSSKLNKGNEMLKEKGAYSSLHFVMGFTIL